MSIVGRKFINETLTDASVLSGTLASKCVFENCELGNPKHCDLTVISGASIADSKASRCVVDNVLFRDCSLSNLKSAGAGRTNIFKQCAFDTVVLRGKISGILVTNLDPDWSQPAMISQIRAHYDGLKSYALDIREAQLDDVSLNSIPGRFVRLDSSEDCTVDVAAAERVVANAADLRERFPEMGIEVADYFAPTLLTTPWLESIVIPCPRGTKRYESARRELRELAEAGFVTLGNV